MPGERPHAATTIGGVLRQQAAILGSRPFLKIWASGEGTVVSLSFAEVHRRTELAAAALRARGCAANDRIALLSHANAQCFIYSLGTMMLGATAVQLHCRRPAPAADYAAALWQLCCRIGRTATVAFQMVAHTPAATTCRGPRARGVVSTLERHSGRAMGAAFTWPTAILGPKSLKVSKASKAWRRYDDGMPRSKY